MFWKSTSLESGEGAKVDGPRSRPLLLVTVSELPGKNVYVGEGAEPVIEMESKVLKLPRLSGPLRFCRDPPMPMTSLESLSPGWTLPLGPDSVTCGSQGGLNTRRTRRRRERRSSSAQ